MPAVGFEMDLPDRGLRAVVVDDNGTVVRRFDPGPVAAATLRKGLDELSAGLKFAAVGVASDGETTGPSHPSIRATHASRPGAAAVVAEAWVGAARGAKHAICLSIGERVL